jgi:hypothetical protein
MKKVFHFDSPRERYRCDAVVVACFDSRFEIGFRKFLKRLHVVASDPIKVAGGARALASAEDDPDRQFVLDQVRKSMRLHGTTRAILMLHSDCGAYGGLEAFGNDAAAEAEHHRLELHRASANLRRAIPGLRVDAYFVDFEGIWEPQLDTADASASSLAASS